jgi:hypothetical protein
MERAQRRERYQGTLFKANTKINQSSDLNDEGSETHEEEKDSDARLESCDAVASVEVQPTDEHAE